MGTLSQLRIVLVLALLAVCLGGKIDNNIIKGKDAGFEKLLQTPDTTQKQRAAIPKIVHFIFGMKGESPPFTIDHYLAVKSAHDAIKPEVIYFWYHWEPETELWFSVKPLVVMKPIDLITTVYGNHIEHFAHMADVIRLMVLHEYGGIYLDIDVVSLKPFDNLLHHDMVLGQEGTGSNAVGLCNAVILSKPKSAFLRRWMASYKNFDGIIWNYHSVQLPGKMAKEFPDEVLVLDYDAFFWPLWNSNGMQTMFMRKDYDYTNNYAVHLWESNAREWFLSKTSIRVINEIDNSLFCEVRRFVKEEKYDKNTEQNCKIWKTSMFKDGTVGVYTFDEDTDIKIKDSLGNHMNGWALNGTALLSSDSVQGTFRDFNGRGDFAIIPTLESQTLDELTISMKIKTPRSCKHRKILAAMQHPAGHSVVLETDCVSRNDVGEVMEIRAILTDKRLGVTSYNLKPWLHYLNNGKWHQVALTISAAAGKMILYLDGESVGDSKWPIKPDGSQQLKNIWLGTKPPPSIRTMKRPIEFDFKGYMDEIVIAQKAFSAESIKSINEGNPESKC